ncbi:PilZ domain-containing protein [Azohydromonas caseinilytica]|uniref:Pilus assembly protein PilZ n=1 Tax=Azohydromonas caseinilytica TaxID=2728836 RepID=A0A848FDE9_9BURK|nr:PilZ domain-containing protein [Azohydromonas caseinilytica]NML17398.1 pilus assembly protein PilZ [Azohydromonas caseinilytica]
MNDSLPIEPIPAQPTLVPLALTDRAALYAAYIPLFAEGGLFIATAREHRLGDLYEVVLTLPGETERRTVAGKVAWITPVNATGGRAQGVGVVFAGDAESRALKARIEEILGAELASVRPTQVF